MDLEKAKSKPYYWTAFAFEDDPNDLHCTHKFMGDLDKDQEKLVKAVLDGYFKLKPFKKFKAKFDKEEFFGESEDVRVITTSDSKDKFHLELRDMLNPLREDDFDYNPHVTCDEDNLNKEFTRYVLMKGKKILQEWK